MLQSFLALHTGCIPGIFFHKEIEDETLEKIWFCTNKILVFFFLFGRFNSPLFFFVDFRGMHLIRNPSQLARTVHVDRPNRVENRFSVTSAEKLAERRAGAATCAT